MFTNQKRYDAEFSPRVLNMLKKRDILGGENFAHLIPLDYNLDTFADELERKFQQERKSNPLLETTRPEAWIASELVPIIQEIRSQTGVNESTLSSALQKYLKRAKVQTLTDAGSENVQLCTTIEAYVALIKKFLHELFDRRKSLYAILRLSRDAYTVDGLPKTMKPSFRREDILLRGIRENRRNQHIVTELDAEGLKPRNFGSYREMYRTSPKSFYSWKNGVKRKYRDAASYQDQEPK